jgi:4'-phosphopantetheinyl transferase
MNSAPLSSRVELWQVLRRGQDVAAQTSLLSPQELSHLSTLADAATCDRYVLTRAALRVLLSRWISAVAPQEWRFTRAAHGRPELAGPVQRRSLSFNVAHTDDQIIVALSAAGRVGVDVEAQHRCLDALALARRYFRHEEIAALQALPASQQPRRFLELWTLKEACVKATGEGLARGLRRVGFLLDHPSLIAPLPTGHGRDETWQFWQWSLASTHLVALAWQREHETGGVQWGRLQNLQPVEMEAPRLLRASVPDQARMYSSTNLEP